MIYFIQAGENGLIKIGYSHSPEQRLAKLQTASPVPLKILITVDGDMGFEARLHRKFADFRAEGEWFYPVKPIKDFIELNKYNGCLAQKPRKVFALDKSMIAKCSLFDLTYEQIAFSPPQKGIEEYHAIIQNSDIAKMQEAILAGKFDVLAATWEAEGILTVKDLADKIASPIIREIRKISPTYNKWLDNLDKAVLKEAEDRFKSLGYDGPEIVFDEAALKELRDVAKSSGTIRMKVKWQ